MSPLAIGLVVVAAASFVAVGLVYGGYPPLIGLLATLFPARPVRQEPIEPTVTLFISCFNEADVLRDKLANALALDYPKQKLQIIVVSDASDDGTDAIAQEHADRGVELVRQQERKGKTSGLNLAVPHARGEILVFSDANAFYEPDAIRMLVRNFADERVGYAVGEARYVEPGESSGASENLYWKYEMWLKRKETRLHSMVGGDGAIYACRKELYKPLRVDDINDFVNPLQIVHQGYRGIYEPEAVALEETAGSYGKEFRRKARIVNRSFSGLMRVAGVLNPFRTGWFALEVFCHKLLRWLAPYLIVAFVLSILGLSLLGYAPFTWLFVGFVAFYGLFWLGFAGSDRWRGLPFVSLPYYFVLVNTASAVGVWQALRGRVQVTWSSPRAREGGRNRPLAANLLVHGLMVGMVGYVAWSLSKVF